jgi:hypothetical protein
MRRRVLCPLRCKKYAQTLRLQRPYRCSRFQAPIAPKANVRNLDPVELDAQRRRCLSSTRWTPAQSHDMTPVVDDDALGVNLAQVGPPNDEPAFPAALGKSRSSFIAEPDTGRSCRQQELRAIDVMRADLCDITLGVMQCLMIIEKDPRRRHKRSGRRRPGR